jgi:hypothetical protein
MFFPWHLHKQAFSSVTCRLLCEAREYQFNGRLLFKEVSLKFNFPYITKKILNGVFSWMANTFQRFWEYFGLPIEEIEFIAQKNNTLPVGRNQVAPKTIGRLTLWRKLPLRKKRF